MRLRTVIRFFYNAFVCNDDYSRFVIAEKISNAIYPSYKFSEYGRSYLNDKKFSDFYEKYVGKNTHSYDRKYFLKQLVKLVIHLEGDIAECGVFEGASAFLMFDEIKHEKNKIHLFDSFEGLSVPDSVDGEYWKKGDLSVSEQQVADNLPDSERIVFHKGWIPSRFNEVSDTDFKFVHLDVDLYQPTYDSLVFFYPRMVQGGIFVCDDYGFDSCPGAKKALDDFFVDKEEIIRVPTGQAFIVKR